MKLLMSPPTPTRRSISIALLFGFGTALSATDCGGPEIHTLPTTICYEPWPENQTSGGEGPNAEGLADEAGLEAPEGPPSEMPSAPEAPAAPQVPAAEVPSSPPDFSNPFGGGSSEPEEPFVLPTPTRAQWIGLLTAEDEHPSPCDQQLRNTAPLIASCGGRSPALTPELSPIPARVVGHHYEPGNPTYDLVWVATHRARDENDPRVRGPIAIVARTETGLEIQALGWYFGSLDAMELRFWKLGNQWVVGIESSIDGVRGMDLMLQAAGALVTAAIESPSGVCEVPGRVTLYEQIRRPLRPGWQQRIVRTGSVSAQRRFLVVDEHLRVQEVDLENPDTSPIVSIDADGRRALRPDRGGVRFHADHPPLELTEQTGCRDCDE